MATAPSISNLTTTADAFKHPLPTVRGLHRQLGIALDEKNARLRTLVGGSYRQLLGTAETIVDMRRDIEVAERKLERVADGCGRGVVGKKVAGLGKLDPARNMLGDDMLVGDLGWMARIKMLDGCVMTVRKLLRGKTTGKEEQEVARGHRLVAAAKVLVLSRLLLKSLGDQTGHKEEVIVEELRKKISGLRRRLLNAIDRTLQRVEDNRDDLAEALCAYSLATSSGAKDVLRHFLHVRGEAIALAFEDEEHVHASEYNVIQALSLYTRTLLDVQALVPRRLSESLQNLKAKALLQQQSIKDFEALRLDVGEKWLNDEILYFTPYIRHDDLEGSQAVETLRGWAKKASEVLLQGLKKTLERISEFKTAVDLRTKVLEMWIKEGGKAKGFDSSVILDELREVLNDRLVSLIEARISKLHLVGTEVEATLAGWSVRSNEKSSGLWDEKLLDMDLNNGASRFKKAIVAQVHGRNDIVSRVVNSFETWRRLVDELFESITQLKKQRWDDDLENLDDDLMIEDRNALLSSDDPAMLQKRVDRSLKQAFYDLHDKLSTLSATYRESDSDGSISIFILRIIREIRMELPKSTDIQSFGLSMVPEFQRTLAASASSEPLAIFRKTLLKKKKVIGRALWEGTPPLPVQPSPSLFRLLHDVASSMSIVGNDLWSPASVGVLKLSLNNSISQDWRTALGSLSSTEPKSNTVDQNGDVKPLNGEQDKEDTKPEVGGSDTLNGNGEKVGTGEEIKLAWQETTIQWIFDVQVLRCCLEFHSKVDEETGLSSFEQDLKAEAALADASIARMQQSSQEYWKRTSLLFGLLS